MPRVLVDVRHEAAHNELPTLPLLRSAASHALTWLKGHYWDRQSEGIQAAKLRAEELIAVRFKLQPVSVKRPFFGKQAIHQMPCSTSADTCAECHHKRPQS